jgi:hypothetical protein
MACSSMLSGRNVKSELDPQAQFSPIMAFEEFGSVRLNPVIKALTQARDHVLSTIREFDQEF